MQSVERISSLGERREQRLVAEAAGQLEIGRVSGQRRDVREHLVHAAVLGAQHAFELLAAHWGDRRGRPRRELRQDVERRGAGGVQVRITQAGEHLVHRVPGHADERPARDGVLELRRAIRKRAHQPASRGRLTGAQLGNDVVDALLHPVVAGRRVHQ